MKKRLIFSHLPPILWTITVGIASFFNSDAVKANPGILDENFGTGGLVTTDFGAADFDGDGGRAVALQSDGKIVVAGSVGATTAKDFALARFDTDGKLDNTFDTDGKVTTDFFGNGDYGNCLAIQSDGKILVAGQVYDGTTNQFGLARYNTNGSLDTSFDGDGLVTNTFGWAAYTIAIQTDGKILVAGFTGGGDFAIARYTNTGMLDNSFDSDGMVTTDFGGNQERIFSLKIQGDGKILAAGYSNASGTNDFALARYLADGTLDNSFHTDGRVITGFGDTFSAAWSLDLQTDGKIVLGGYSSTDPVRTDFALARYETDGDLDPSFGTGGKLTTDFDGHMDTAYKVLVQPDGKILAGGYANTNDGNANFGLARYTTTGALDSQFGKGGKVTTDFAGKSDHGWDMALQADGRIVVAGYATYPANNSDFAVARYGTDYQPDNIINGKGNNIYNTSGAGQTHNLVSKKARTVRATLVIQNDGLNADTMMLRGTRGNNFFKVTYTSGGNMTGAVTAGTFVTPALNPGETHAVQVTVKPNKKKLQKKTKKGKKTVIKWLKKKITLALTSTSNGNTAKKDVARVKVQHK